MNKCTKIFQSNFTFFLVTSNILNYNYFKTLQSLSTFTFKSVITVIICNILNML